MSPIQPKILRYQSLPSTNNEAARLAALGAEEGIVVVAEEQTAGRGRLQRTWLSPKGAGLYSTILLRPKMPQDRWPLFTFIAALSVGDALAETCGLTTDIKWPNDLLAGERKICGILAEVVETPTGRGIILGIGINLAREAFPPEVKDVAISVEEATGKLPQREPVLNALVKALLAWYSVAQQVDSSDRVLNEWMKRSSFAEGKSVRVVNGDETICGVTRGLESDGALRVETESGEISVIHAGDVTHLRDASPSPGKSA